MAEIFKSCGFKASAASVFCLLILPATSFAQTAVSAQAGLIPYAEGQVFIDKARPSPTKGTGLHHLAEGERLRTEGGRAEMNLGPDDFVHIGEDSAVEIVSAKLGDIKLRWVSGSGLVHVVKKSPENTISLLLAKSSVKFRTKGLYRIDAQDGQSPVLKVLRGEAFVSIGESRYEVTSKHSLVLDGATGGHPASKFRRSGKDPLDRWSRQRVRQRTLELAAAERSKRQQENAKHAASQEALMRKFPNLNRKVR